MLYDLNPVEKEGERNIWCEHYDTCLDYVVDKFWQRWDCSQCKHRSNQELKIEIRLREQERTELYDLSI